MIESQKERITNLEKELEEVPRVRQRDIQDSKVNSSLQQMVESQKERIEILEAQLNQERKDVENIVHEVADANAISVMQQMIMSQKEKIEGLEDELHHKPKEVVNEVMDTKQCESLQQIVESQQEKIANLEAELDQKPKEVLVQVKDTKKIEALLQMVTSQQERIEILETELYQKPKEIIVENTKTDDAAKEMIASQKEHIENLEKLLEQNNQELITTKMDVKKVVSLEQMVCSQRECIKNLEEQLEQKPKETIIEVEDTSARKILEENLERKIGEIKRLEKSSKMTKFEDGEKITALKTIVDCQKERIEILEKELESTPHIMGQIIPSEATNQRIVAMEQMLESLKEREAMNNQITMDHLLEIKILKATIEDLTGEKAMGHQIEKIAKQESAEGQSWPEQVQVVKVPLQSSPQKMQQRSDTSDSDDDERDNVKVEHQKKMVNLMKENDALKEIVKSQSEQLEIMAKEIDMQYEHPDGSKENELSSYIGQKKNVADQFGFAKTRSSSESSSSECGSASEEVEDLSHENINKDIIERNENLSKINVELQNQLENYEEIARLAEELQVEKNSLLDENRELKEEIFSLRQLATFGDETKRERDNAIEDRSRIQLEVERLQEAIGNSNAVDQEKYMWAEEKAHLASEILGLKSTIDEQTKLLDGSEKYTESLQQDNKELKSHIDGLQEILAKKDQEFREKDQKLKEGEQALLIKLARLNEILSKKDNELKELDMQLSETQDTLKSIKEQHDDEKDNLMEENVTLIERNSELIMAVQELEKKNQEIQIENEVLRRQKGSERARNSVSRSSSSDSESDKETDLEREVLVPREMVVIQKEQMETLQASADDELIMAVDAPEQRALPGNLAEDLKNENQKLREALQELEHEKEAASPQLLGTALEELQLRNEELIDENEQLHENITHLQKLLHDASDELHDDNTELLEENEVLKEMVDSLNDEKLLLERELQNSKPSENLGITDERPNIALQAIVESLKEERDLLEKQMEEMKTELADDKSEESSDSSDSEDGGDDKKKRHFHSEELIKENAALKAMVERLTEELDSVQNPEVLQTQQNETFALNAMIECLKEDRDSLETQLEQMRAELDAVNEIREKREESSDSSDGESDEEMEKGKDVHRSQLIKENIALKAMIDRLKEELESVHNPELKRDDQSQIVALQAIVDSLKEERDILDKQLEEMKADGKVNKPREGREASSDSSSNEDDEGVKLMNKCSDDLMIENMALKSMLERLKEELESVQKPEFLQVDQNETVALLAMMERLKEDNDLLEKQLEQMKAELDTVNRIREKRKESSDSSESEGEKEGMDFVQKIHANESEQTQRAPTQVLGEDYMKENEALKEIVASLKDDKLRLETELENLKSPEKLSITDQSQTVALQAMIESVKEERDLLEKQLEQMKAELADGRVKKVIEKHEESSDSSDSEDDDEKKTKGELSSDDLLKQNIALKAMVERLKEDQDSVQNPEFLQTDKNETVALLAMIECLKEDNDLLEKQLEQMKAELDMMNRIREKRKESSDSSESEGEKEGMDFVQKIHANESEQTQRAPTQVLGEDYMKENEALKEIVASLKDDKLRLETELENLKSPEKLSITDQSQTVALQAMIESVKEERDLLEKQLEQMKAELADGRVKKVIEKHEESSDSSDSEDDDEKKTKGELSSDDLLKQNIALKAMVERLKEDQDSVQNPEFVQTDKNET
ncbi:hypothetical protein LSH36_107g12028 [Paralvinella palmiformis]|uniref:Uncharacterized protein n=1 Tax=Paralvinella palmiformis TaxID=53620 RepID=A0AAD9JYT9_9ANNE|nr:hypothetical protein LSH36_107g12028 [Paralvinella palmiformis]